MKTITMIGWSAKVSAVVERVTFWPDEMEMNLAIAKAAQILDLMTVEEVLAEEEANVTAVSGDEDSIEIPPESTPISDTQ